MHSNNACFLVQKSKKFFRVPWLYSAKSQSCDLITRRDPTVEMLTRKYFQGRRILKE